MVAAMVFGLDDVTDDHADHETHRDTHHDAERSRHGANDDATCHAREGSSEYGWTDRLGDSSRSRSRVRHMRTVSTRRALSKFSALVLFLAVPARADDKA